MGLIASGSDLGKAVKPEIEEPMNIQGNIKKQRRINKWKTKKNNEIGNSMEMYLKVPRSIQLKKHDWVRFDTGEVMKITNKTYPMLDKFPEKDYQRWLTGMKTLEAKKHPSEYGFQVCWGYIDNIRVEVWRRHPTPVASASGAAKRSSSEQEREGQKP